MDWSHYPLVIFYERWLWSIVFPLQDSHWRAKWSQQGREERGRQTDRELGVSKLDFNGRFVLEALSSAVWIASPFWTQGGAGCVNHDLEIFVESPAMFPFHVNQKERDTLHSKSNHWLEGGMQEQKRMKERISSLSTPRSFVKPGSPCYKSVWIMTFPFITRLVRLSN